MLAIAGCEHAMGTFFIPGTGDDSRLGERAYADMRDTIERDLGFRPNRRRIAKLWARRGRTDCVTEVGQPDPVRGGVVMAIFDLGNCRPFVLWWQPHGSMPAGLPEVLGPHAYAVVEFDA
jgi:hypothetical protein